MPSTTITGNVLEQFVAHGTTAIRTHVDVDLGLGLRGIEVVREAVAAYDGALTVQIVAFPQDGVLRRPGVLELLHAAARTGVDHVGGLDPAPIDRDPVGQIDVILALAAEHGVGVDIHLHDPADLGAFQIELVLDRVERLGLEERVNIAHGFAVAELASPRRRDLLERMGDLGVTMTTVAPLHVPQLPLHEMDSAGVAFAFGTDGIRDLWSPYGTGDLLGITRQYARASGLVRDEDLRRVVELTTGHAAPFAGWRRTGSRWATVPTSCSSTPRTRWMPSSAPPRGRWSSQAGACSSAEPTGTARASARHCPLARRASS